MKKIKKEKKLEKRSKVQENDQGIILNFTSKDSKRAAIAPTKNLKEEMDQKNLAEKGSNANIIMKMERVYENLLLILIEALMHGRWNNTNSDAVGEF